LKQSSFWVIGPRDHPKPGCRANPKRRWNGWAGVRFRRATTVPPARERTLRHFCTFEAAPTLALVSYRAVRRSVLTRAGRTPRPHESEQTAASRPLSIRMKTQLPIGFVLVNLELHTRRFSNEAIMPTSS